MWYDWPSALCVVVSGFHSAVYATSVLRMYQQVSLNVILLFIQQQIILLVVVLDLIVLWHFTLLVLI